MTLLLDTCAFLLLATGNTKLSRNAFDLIATQGNASPISAVSAWEINMKMVIGKLDLSITFDQLMQLADDQAISVLPLSIQQVRMFNGLPPTHRDPFDRLLAAVAIEGGYTFLSPENVLDSIGVRRVW